MVICEFVPYTIAVEGIVDDLLPVCSSSYTCPNGHPYIITECGGAMQVSQCPDCGAQIGGSSHILIDGNAQDASMEELLRGSGVQRSPWPWAQ